MWWDPQKKIKKNKDFFFLFIFLPLPDISLSPFSFLFSFSSFFFFFFFFLTARTDPATTGHHFWHATARRIRLAPVTSTTKRHRLTRRRSFAIISQSFESLTLTVFSGLLRPPFGEWMTPLESASREEQNPLSRSRQLAIFLR